jgi:hypothetical protein
VPNAYSVKEDYTLYLVFNPSVNEGGLSVIYGDDSGDTMGMCFGNVKFDANGGIEKVNPKTNTFKVRHDGRTGEPAFTATEYQFPENHFDTDEGETCHVFVIRRDKAFNLYLHNRSGELVAFIPGFSKSQTPTGRDTSMDGMTDGDLLIEQIGSGGGIIATSGLNQSFKGYLPRFGVIEKDIGTNAAATLAQDLFNLYNL